MTTYTDVFGGSTIYPSEVSLLEVTLAADLRLSWPLDTFGGDNPAARILDVTAATAGLSIYMPDAREASTGQTVLFNNLGATETFTVRDSAGAQLAVVAPGTQWQAYLAVNTTAAGTWRVLQFGASTATVQPSALAGAGLIPSGSTLSVAAPVTTFSTSGITVSTSNRAGALVWTGAGSGTLNLSGVATLGNNFFVYVRNSGGGALTIDPNGSETINGGATLTLMPGDSAQLICDGAAWYTIGFGQNAVFAFDYTSIAVTGGTYTLAGSELNRVAYKFTGTLTSDCTVIVPSTIQQYWINNATTGSFTLSFKTAAGTPVQVNQGSRGIYYCDGVSVILADTASISLPITIAQGGTGAATASAARLSLGISSFADAIVTATSGASVRTTIGAAQSGANGDITSLVGLGSGTAAAPSITFSGDTNTGLYRTGADGLGITTGGVVRLAVDSAGLVTVAGNFAVNGSTTLGDAAADTVTLNAQTINPGSTTTFFRRDLNNGQTALEIQNGGTGTAYARLALRANNTANAFVTLDVQNNGGTPYAAFGSGAGVSGGLLSNFAGYYWRDIGGTEWMRLTGGNLGIGTTSPSTKLEIAATGAPTLRINSTDAQSPTLQLFRTGGSAYQISANSSVVFSVDRIDSTGAVTATPFSINSGGTATFTGVIRGPSASASAPSFSFSSDTDTGIFSPGAGLLAASTGGTERVRIDASGNVGIGTTPFAAANQYKLVMDGNFTMIGQARAVAFNVYNDGAWKYAGDGYGWGFVTSSADGKLTIRSTAASNSSGAGAAATFTTRMTFDPSGGVQIPDLLNLTGTEGNQLGWTIGSQSWKLSVNPAGKWYLNDATNGKFPINVEAGAPNDTLTLRSWGGMTSPNVTDAIGYKGLPQNSQAAGYTLVLADMGKHINQTSGGVTIPANASVAFPIGTQITIFNNQAAAMSLAITTDTLRWAGETNTGDRNIAAYSVVTLLKVASTVWVASTPVLPVGVGQTWQAVSRVANTSYQNTNGRAIQVMIEHDSSGAFFQVSADGSTWVTLDSGTNRGRCTAIIPEGHYYRVVNAATINYAAELK